MPRFGPGGEIIINGWLSKIITGLLVTAIPAGFWALLAAHSLANDYTIHKESEASRISEIKARTDKLWDEQISDRVIQSATQQEIGRARERQERIEAKINTLLVRSGVDPSKLGD